MNSFDVILCTAKSFRPTSLCICFRVQCRAEYLLSVQISVFRISAICFGYLGKLRLGARRCLQRSLRQSTHDHLQNSSALLELSYSCWVSKTSLHIFTRHPSSLRFNSAWVQLNYRTEKCNIYLISRIMCPAFLFFIMNSTVYYQHDELCVTYSGINPDPGGCGSDTRRVDRWWNWWNCCW